MRQNVTINLIFTKTTCHISTVNLFDELFYLLLTIKICNFEEEKEE